MTSAASRVPYVAQTPDVGTCSAKGGTASFPLARLDGDEEQEVDGDGIPPRAGEYNDPSHWQPEVGSHSRWASFKANCEMIYRNNIGLLLIAISVAFASMMSTLVKLMNSIDPPVPMLEVSLVH